MICRSLGLQNGCYDKTSVLLYLPISLHLAKRYDSYGQGDGAWEINGRHSLLHGVQACSRQWPQLHVSDFNLTQIFCQWDWLPQSSLLLWAWLSPWQSISSATHQGDRCWHKICVKLNRRRQLWHKSAAASLNSMGEDGARRLLFGHMPI